MSGTGLNWISQHPRFLANIRGLGQADIVGFGPDGVWLGLGTGDGTFQQAELAQAGPAQARPSVLDLGFNSGWRVDQHLLSRRPDG